MEEREYQVIIVVTITNIAESLPSVFSSLKFPRFLGQIGFIGFRPSLFTR